MDGQTDRQTDGQTDVGHINLIGGLVTRNPPKKGGFSPPVHLVFHFFQPNLAHILRFAKGIS